MIRRFSACRVTPRILAAIISTLKVLKRLFAMDPEPAASGAIQHALRSGGRDNITALFIDMAV